MSAGRKFACPTCGDVTEVLDSRVKHAGIRRRRVCPAGHRFNTEEVVLPDDKLATRRIKPEEVAEWQAMRDAGHRVRKIAQKYDRDQSTIYSRTTAKQEPAP